MNKQVVLVWEISKLKSKLTARPVLCYCLQCRLMLLNVYSVLNVSFKKSRSKHLLDKYITHLLLVQTAFY